MRLLHIFILGLCLIIIEGQRPQKLKIVPNGRKANSIQPQFFGGPQPPPTPIHLRKDTTDRFTGLESICIFGMWAAYSTINFGEMEETSTSVDVYRSLDLKNCTRLPLNNTKSLNFLGSGDLDIDQVSIYNEPNFLGGFLNISGPTGPFENITSGFNLGSIAITGNKAWLICEDADCNYSICIDASKHGGAFYYANKYMDYCIYPIWPKIVRRVEITTSSACLNENNPEIDQCFTGLTTTTTLAPVQGY